MTPEHNEPLPNTAANGANSAPGWDDCPIPEEVLDDWRWINQERGTGRFDDYAGEHVAVLNQTVLGSSRDPNLLRLYLSEKHHLDPERLVIFYVDTW